MKREIKFRAWDGKEMIFSNPMPNHSFWKYVAYDDTTPVMQFTGIRDKNGKEIYGGDVLRILRIGSNPDRIYTGVVEWRTEQAGWMIKCGKFMLEILSLAMSGDGLETRLDGAEIIGNIYESPELLNPQP